MTLRKAVERLAKRYPDDKDVALLAETLAESQTIHGAKPGLEPGAPPEMVAFLLVLDQ